MEGNINGTICNYCGLLIKSGGITRFKFYLSHTDPHSNTKKFPRVPPEVKEEIRELLLKKTKAKAKKVANIEEVRVVLCGTIGDNQRYVIDEDDDDDNDVYMYPTNMYPDEQDAYRAAVQASKATEWDQQQHETFVGSKHKTGESSRPSDAPRPMRKSQSIRYSEPSSPITPSLYKSSTARQINIKDLFKCGSIKETMDA